MKLTVLDIINLKSIFRKLSNIEYTNFKDAIDIADYSDSLDIKSRSFSEIQKKLSDRLSSIKSKEDVESIDEDLNKFYNTELDFNPFKVKEEYINKISLKPFEAKTLNSLDFVEKFEHKD